MSTFSDRAFAALAQFNGRLTTFVDLVTATPPHPPALPRKALDELLQAAGRARTAADAIAQSLTLIDATALDIVDMQVRLQGETARLASALRTLGEAVDRQAAVRTTFGDTLVGLDEAAHLVGAAIFPSAADGLRDLNVKLWDFEKIQWKRYTDILTGVVQRAKITSEQEARIQNIADDVARAFGEVNTLINEVAEARPTDAAALRRRLQQAPERLTGALATATDRLAAAAATFKPFASVIKASRKIADEVAKLLRAVTIPIYPAHDRLGACCDYISPADYDALSGVQAFALLNILARLHATTAAGRSLLDRRNVKITRVFPDRIYLEADASLVADLKQDAGGRAATFTSAPASLHRFNEGSFKQTTFRKGNLQISYATRPGNRVAVDADIDLYRGAIPHLFGEVLVNHLTGRTTDQYAVRAILDEQRVAAIGGFHLLQV